MPTTAELIHKEEEEFKKARNRRRSRLKKIEEDELKRLFRILKLTDYFKYEFSDKELFNGLKQIVQMKKNDSPLLNAEEYPRKKKTIVLDEEEVNTELSH